MLLFLHFFYNTNYIRNALKNDHRVFEYKPKNVVLVVFWTILLHDQKKSGF